MTALDWAARAICVGEDPEIFFSDDPDAMTRRESICRHCPARRDCLSYAESDPTVAGYWGGQEISPRVAKRGGSTRGLEAHRERLAARIQERIDSGKKSCSRCKSTLPFERFHRQVTSADGHKSICVDCLNTSDRTAGFRQAGPVLKKCSFCAGLKPIGEFRGYPQCGPCREPQRLAVAA